MDDRRALMGAILANPDEDTPRLALADWLQEHGDRHDQARAEFIRLEIEAERLPRNDAQRKKLERRAWTLQTRHQDAWLAPLLVIDRELPPPYVYFSRGLLSFLPIAAGAFLKPRYQRDLPDALARVGVERLVFGTAPKSRFAALTESLALRSVRAVYLPRIDDDSLCLLGASPNCTHLNELYFNATEITDSGLRAFAKTTAMVALRRFGISDFSRQPDCTASGVRAVLNSSRLPLLDTLKLNDKLLPTFKFDSLLRDPGLQRLTRLELVGPGPMAAIVACKHFRQLLTLVIGHTTITDADVEALFANSAFDGLTHLELTAVNPNQPRLSKDSELRLAKRFGSNAIRYVLWPMVFARLRPPSIPNSARA